MALLTFVILFTETCSEYYKVIPSCLVGVTNAFIFSTGKMSEELNALNIYIIELGLLGTLIIVRVLTRNVIV